MPKQKVTNVTNALQEQAPDSDKVLTESVKAIYPAWPSSRPGPRSTPPLAGMKPVNPLRREQVAEVAYNQETGEPESRPTSEEKASPFIHKKPKQRL